MQNLKIGDKPAINIFKQLIENTQVKYLNLS